MYTLNEKVKNLKPYDPISGNYHIRLDANESFITLPQEIKQEIADHILCTHFNRYPDPYAADCCAGFAKFFGVPASCVMAGNGSDEVISVIMNAFLQKGDTVVTLARDFSMYAFYASIVECRSVAVQNNPDYSIPVDAVIDCVKRENARMVVFSNPCNPTSLVLPRDEVRRLVQSVDALVVLDEAYMDFSDQSLLSEFSQYDNLIILKTCSKAIGMAGVRLGFAVANETLTKVLLAVKSPYNLNSMTQAVGTVLFDHPDYIRSCVRRILESRDELYEHFSRISKAFPGAFEPQKPETNFLYVRCKDAEGLFKHLKSKGIIVRLMGDHLRISAGRNYENEAVSEEIEAYLKGATQ